MTVRRAERNVVIRNFNTELLDLFTPLMFVGIDWVKVIDVEC